MESFSFECMGCVKMKELEVEMEQLRLLVCLCQWWEGYRWVVPVVPVGGQQMIVGDDDEGDARESSPQPGRRLRLCERR